MIFNYIITHAIFLLFLWIQLKYLHLRTVKVTEGITSIMSKICELLIRKRHYNVMETISNLFKCNPKHGTEQSVFVLKHVIGFYEINGDHCIYVP